MSDAVVVGFEANGLGVARALAKENIPVIAIATPAWNASWYTRCAQRVIKCREWSENVFIETLIALGKELPAQAPLLITKDEPVLWVSAHREELGRYFKIALPSHDTVQLLMSKVRFESYARQQNWPLPVSCSASTQSELQACADSVPYPCILKVAVKNADFRKNSPSKAFKLADRESLLQTYDMVRQWESDVIVQEWVPGSDDRVTYCLGCWSTQGKPMALFAGCKLRLWPPECGGTAIAAPAPEEWEESLVSLTTSIMGAMGYQGLGSIEYKMRPNGMPVIMEPTVGRTNYQNEIAVLNGINIPAAAYYDLMGMHREASQWSGRKPAATPVKLIDSAGDRRSARVYMDSGRLTPEEWKRSRSGPRRFMLFRADDPMPFTMFAFRRITSYAKRALTKIFGQRRSTHPDKPEALA